MSSSKSVKRAATARPWLPRLPCDVEVVTEHDGYEGRVYFGRLINIKFGYGLVEYPYPTSDEDPTPLRQWLPMPTERQRLAPLLREGVERDQVMGYLRDNEHQLPALERSVILRPRCIGKGSRVKVSQERARKLPVGHLLEVQRQGEPEELILVYTDLVGGQVVVKRVADTEEPPLTWEELSAIYLGHRSWDPTDHEWSIIWALATEKQPGEVFEAGLTLPDSVYRQKLVFMKPRVTSLDYHRGQVRHVDDDIIEVMIEQGAPDGVHDILEAFHPGSNRIWRGRPEQLMKVAPGRWRTWDSWQRERAAAAAQQDDEEEDGTDDDGGDDVDGNEAGDQGYEEQGGPSEEQHGGQEGASGDADDQGSQHSQEQQQQQQGHQHHLHQQCEVVVMEGGGPGVQGCGEDLKRWRGARETEHLHKQQQQQGNNKHQQQQQGNNKQQQQQQQQGNNKHQHQQQVGTNQQQQLGRKRPRTNLFSEADQAHILTAAVAAAMQAAKVLGEAFRSDADSDVVHDGTPPKAAPRPKASSPPWADSAPRATSPARGDSSLVTWHSC